MEKNNTKKRTVFRTAGTLAGAAAFILLVSNSRFFFPAEEEVLTPPLKKPEEVVYDTHKVGISSIKNTVTCRGYFQPERQYDVSFSDREGYLKALHVASGQQVKAGDIIAVLDIDQLTNALKQQEIALKAAEESLERLEDISEIELSTAGIQLEELKEDLALKRSLADSIAGKDLKKLENQVRIQENQFRKMKIDAGYQVSSSKHQIETIGLRIDELKMELKKSTITSPITGTVAYTAAVDEGEFVKSYKVIATVADPGRLILEYTGQQHSNFHAGMKVQVVYADANYDGEVVLTPISVPREDFEQMKETIHVRVDGLPKTCREGDSAMLEAVLDWADDVIVIPKRLVHQYSGRWFVKVLEDGIVNERDIEVGIESPTEYQIIGGLEPGELVVE